MIKVDANAFSRLLNDVALIKEILISGGADAEGEPAEWAKKELEEARQIPRSENISLEELEAKISAR